MSEQHTPPPYHLSSQSYMMDDPHFVMANAEGNEVAAFWIGEPHNETQVAEAKATAEFCIRAANNHKALVQALGDLLEQIDCLGGIEYCRDLEPYKAEACWEDAYSSACTALKAAKEGAS